MDTDDYNEFLEGIATETLTDYLIERFGLDDIAAEDIATTQVERAVDVARGMVA